jgi:methionine synthase II (cobalamin-independent)
MARWSVMSEAAELLRPAPSSWLGNGLATAIGSLPHRDAVHAARFALTATALPTMPTLPRRSPREGLVGQALVGLAGVSVGQYGSVSVDVGDIDPAAPVATDLADDAFAGFRALLDEARLVGYRGDVKWQFVGPVTVGVTLMRAGLPAEIAFDVATNAVCARLAQLHAAVAAALPGSRQLVIVDEPAFADALDPDFPVALDVVVDVVSMAMSAVEPVASVGVHCCGVADLGALLATGPHVLSIPVNASVATQASRISQFLAHGGVVAWGAVTTEGPIPTSVERPWKALSAAWCALVGEGVDPGQLRRQSMITPACGLGTHTPSVAERVHHLTAELSRRVRDQAMATRFSLGA